MPGLFVTATGTEVGKTFVSAGLIAACRRAGRRVTALKPIVSGFDDEAMAASDTAVLLDALGLPTTAATIAALSPWRFEAPLSPDMAAALEGRSIDFAAVVAFCRTHLRDEFLVIEGIGGVMVPLGRGRTVLDLIATLPVPVLLVSPTGLGAISHLLTALEALRTRGAVPAAIVLSETPGSGVPLDGMLTTLGDFYPKETIFVLHRTAGQAEMFDTILAHLDRVVMPPAASETPSAPPRRD